MHPAKTSVADKCAWKTQLCWARSNNTFFSILVSFPVHREMFRYVLLNSWGGTLLFILPKCCRKESLSTVSSWAQAPDGVPQMCTFRPRLVARHPFVSAFPCARGTRNKGNWTARVLMPHTCARDLCSVMVSCVSTSLMFQICVTHTRKQTHAWMAGFAAKCFAI